MLRVRLCSKGGVQMRRIDNVFTAKPTHTWLVDVWSGLAL